MHSGEGIKRDSERWQTRVLALELNGSYKVCSFFCTAVSFVLHQQPTPTTQTIRFFLEEGRILIHFRSVYINKYRRGLKPYTTQTIRCRRSSSWAGAL